MRWMWMKVRMAGPGMFDVVVKREEVNEFSEIGGWMGEGWWEILHGLLVSKEVVVTKELEKAGSRCVALKAAVVDFGHSQVIYLD
jgi:hypothetical protein